MVQPPEVRLVRESAIGEPGTIANDAVKNAASAAVASSGVLTPLAATAVAQRLVDSGVVSGGRPITANDAVAFSITGSNGRRSWIEIGQDGRPTPESAAIIASAITNAVNALIAAKTDPLPVPKSTPDTTGVPFTIVDPSGRRSWVEIAPDGGPTVEAAKRTARGVVPHLANEGLPVPATITDGPGLAYVLTDLSGRKSELQIGLDGKMTGPFPARIVQNATDAAVAAANPAAAIPMVLWGDSMTAPGSGYGDKMTAESGVAVRIQAIGGQGTPSISARQGGYPATVTFPSNTMPADTSATTVTTSQVVYSTPAGTGVSSGHVTILGVPGILARDNATNAVTFTRDAAGTALWVPPTTPIITDEAALNRGQLAIIWSGRNSFKLMAPEDIVYHIQKMVDYMTAGQKRFLVLEIAPTDAEVSVPTPTADRVKLDTLNALLLKTFPHQFVPIGQYLRGPALADMGITPTSQDTTDIANGVTPTSLRGDTLHLNATGNTAVARYLTKTLRTKGWIA